MHHSPIILVTIWNFCLVVKTTINRYAYWAYILKVIAKAMSTYAYCAYILKAIAKAMSTRRYAAKIINNFRGREK